MGMPQQGRERSDGEEALGRLSCNLHRSALAGTWESTHVAPGSLQEEVWPTLGEVQDRIGTAQDRKRWTSLSGWTVEGQPQVPMFPKRSWGRLICWWGGRRWGAAPTPREAQGWLSMQAEHRRCCYRPGNNGDREPTPQSPGGHSEHQKPGVQASVRCSKFRVVASGNKEGGVPRSQEMGQEQRDCQYTTGISQC